MKKASLADFVPLVTGDSKHFLQVATDRLDFEVTSTLELSGTQNIIIDHSSLTTASMSAINVLEGSSGSYLTNIQPRYSPIRAERWQNKTPGLSSTLEDMSQAGLIGAGSFILHTKNGTQQSAALKCETFVGLSSDYLISDHGNVTDKIGLFAAVQSVSSGTDDIWAMNLIAQRNDKKALCRGIEVDIGNLSSADDELGAGQQFDGITVINSGKRSGTAYVVNAAGSSGEWLRGMWVKEVGKIGIEIGRLWAGAVDAMLLGNQLASDTDTILLRRFSNTNPSGSFIRCVNADNTAELFKLSTHTTATNDTTLALSVGGLPARTVGVGTNDSGGTGFRLLRIANSTAT